jgi:hypothetical protein
MELMWILVEDGVRNEQLWLNEVGREPYRTNVRNVGAENYYFAFRDHGGDGLEENADLAAEQTGLACIARG